MELSARANSKILLDKYKIELKICLFSKYYMTNCYAVTRPLSQTAVY